MPTRTSSDPRASLPYTALADDVLTTARQAAGSAAHAYLAGLDAVATAQRRLAAGTPLAPVSEILGAQVELTRSVLEGFVTAPEAGSPRTVARVAEEAVAAPAAAAPARPARTPRTRKPAPARRGSAAKTAASRARTATARTRKAATKTPAAPAKKAAAPAPVPAPALAEPLTGYAALTAEQLIGRLPELSQAVLRDVRAYEVANAARQTVLDRIEDLTAREPLPGYDELTVEDIEPRLVDGGPALAARVLEYERRHKQRAGVLAAAERQAAQDQ